VAIAVLALTSLVVSPVDQASAAASVSAVASACGVESEALVGCGIGPFDAVAPEWGDVQLSVTVVDPATVDVGWAPGAVDPDGAPSYVVIVDGQRWTKTTDTTSRLDSLIPGRTYEVEVRAVDGSGNETVPGLLTTVTTSDDVTPPVWGAAELRATSAGATWLNLVWGPGATDDRAVTGYEIVVDGVPAATVAAVGNADAATNHLLTGLPAATDHTIEVVAIDGAGNRSVDGPSAQLATGPVDPDPLVETGQVTVTGQWRNITFNRTFTDPVVVVGPASDNDPDPGLVVIDEVDATGFDIRFQEWEYQDGDHDGELVSYLVVERGSTVLRSGARIEAGTTSMTSSVREQAFSSPFRIRPALLTAVNGNDGPTVAPRITGLGPADFDHVADVEEAGSAVTGAVDLNWVAWSQGDDSSGQDGAVWETINVNTDENHRLVGFNNVYSQACLFGEVRTNLPDPASVRHQNLSSTSVEVRIAEEQSDDAEVGLGTESLLMLVTDCNEGGSAPDTAPPQWNGGGLVVRAVASDGATLSWAPGAVDDVGVAVYEVRVDGVSVVATTTTGHVLAGLEPERTYSVEVTAIDYAGNVSAVVGPTAFTTLGQGQHQLSPYSWAGRLDFDLAQLPSEIAGQAYTAWLVGVDNPVDMWPHEPSAIFAPLDATSVSHGSYSYSRAGAFWIGSMTDALRTTGDAAIVDRLLTWSAALKANLADHDGRGYDYFQYEAPAAGVNPEFRATDTNLLDEQLLAGNIARLAWALHRNRDVVSGAGPEADFWFDYLDRNWVPKWLMRTSHQTETPYLPPAELGLGNAVGWTSPDNNQHDDEGFGWADDHRFQDEPGIIHTLPVRQIMHPYIASLFQYEVMARYFAETGRPSVLGPDRYGLEAAARADYWETKTSLLGDGSLDIPHLLRNGADSPDADTYVHHLAQYVNDLHWLGVPGFDTDADMATYAKIFYNPAAPDDDVFDAGNTTDMAAYIDGTGTTAFVMLFTSLWARWDRSGELAALNRAVIIDDRQHLIKGDTSQHHGAHYNGILSAELVVSAAAAWSSSGSGDPFQPGRDVFVPRRSGDRVPPVGGGQLVGGDPGQLRVTTGW
jgi:hypothetical protein